MVLTALIATPKVSVINAFYNTGYLMDGAGLVQATASIALARSVSTAAIDIISRITNAEHVPLGVCLATEKIALAAS